MTVFVSKIPLAMTTQIGDDTNRTTQIGDSTLNHHFRDETATLKEPKKGLTVTRGTFATGKFATVHSNTISENISHPAARKGQLNYCWLRALIAADQPLKPRLR